MISISPKNSKLGFIPSLSFPTTVCSRNLPCYSKCYARQISARYVRTRIAYERNLVIWKTAPEDFKKQFEVLCPVSGIFRYFVSGDIPTYSFLEFMVEEAQKFKGVRFYAYTKKYGYINQYLYEHDKFPDNLKIILSGWNGISIPNPFNLPIAFYLDVKNPDKNIKQSALICDCSKHCDSCGYCYRMRKGQSVVMIDHKQRKSLTVKAGAKYKDILPQIKGVAK